MGKRKPVGGLSLDQLTREALDNARLYADESSPISQNWSQIALAAAVFQLAQGRDPQAKAD